MYNMTRKFIYQDFYRPLKSAFISPQPKRLKVGYFNGFLCYLRRNKITRSLHFLKDKGSFYQYPKQQTGNSTRCRVPVLSEVAEFVIVFPGGRGPPRRNLNFQIFRKKQSAMELFISIFENSSPKGSFRQNKINYEILQLSEDSRYLRSGPLKSLVILRIIFIHKFS